MNKQFAIIALCALSIVGLFVAKQVQEIPDPGEPREVVIKQKSPVAQNAAPQANRSLTQTADDAATSADLAKRQQSASFKAPDYSTYKEISSAVLPPDAQGLTRYRIVQKPNASRYVLLKEKIRVDEESDKVEVLDQEATFAEQVLVNVSSNVKEADVVQAAQKAGLKQVSKMGTSLVFEYQNMDPMQPLAYDRVQKALTPVAGSGAISGARVMWAY
jgi:hypothetical protein